MEQLKQRLRYYPITLRFLFSRLIFLICSLLCRISSGALLQPEPLDHWQRRNVMAEEYSLSGVAYGNGAFVAVGNYGTILRSPDGANWSVQPRPVSAHLNSVVYGNGLFL